MAYNLSQRFSGPQRYFAFYDPGTYQNEQPKLKGNKVPFLSKKPRDTSPDVTIWTQALYDGAITYKIPNIASFKYKTERFPYAAFSKEDLKEILCKCGIDSPCECPVTENEQIEEEICQGKVKRRLFKGICPRSVLGDEGLSAPSKNDQGFAMFNGSQKRIKKEILDESPPFYDTRINESTAFYHGWKWSRRTSKRGEKSLEKSPGPADYYLEREPTEDEVCAERVRAYKRKTCPQLRFIEIVQKQNILEGRPGPATYSPTWPKGTDLQYLGPKADRFPTSKHVAHPGPADHIIRRDFDPIDPPDKSCQAILPESAGFGVKARRFIPRSEEGASPATYNINYKPYQFVHCPKTPFGSSAIRFKPDIIEESDDEEVQIDVASEALATRHVPTWPFKSKTIRMKPLVKVMNEPSPADLPQSKYKIERSPQSQYAAPFYSSEGRFECWHNQIPVHGRNNTLEPIFCNLEKPKCFPAFNRGPMFRAKRFSEIKSTSPAPNVYTVPDKMKTVLKTFNKRLADNVENQIKFTWKKPIENKSLNYAQREALLIQKCIALLEPEEAFTEKGKRRLSKAKSIKPVDSEKDKDQENEDRKPKMLHSFLYAYQMPVYF